VQDADWAANGESMAVVRYVPENHHWRLEYPIGKSLVDSINWISHPKISPDGKWVAFADHENPGGDDEGSVAVIGSNGKDKEKKLSSGWTALEGILWSPAGDEIWFTSTSGGSATNPRAVGLSGKLRTITNVPGGVWLEDLRNGTALMVTHQTRIGIRGMAPGGKEERELGWFGWSELSDISPDGRKILFDEEGDGGGPNYTVFLRDTDGSAPARIGEGNAMAISPDAKWVITKPPKGGPLSLVPTGAGESRQLTHDARSYDAVRWLPDGKRLLAVGIEAGHGARDYLIDLSNGNAKPITPDGIAGVQLSPDGVARRRGGKRRECFNSSGANWRKQANDSRHRKIEAQGDEAGVQAAISLIMAGQHQRERNRDSADQPGKDARSGHSLGKQAEYNSREELCHARRAQQPQRYKAH
jgi:eukaryotic-like serine/threonine-protein kinase